MTKEQRHRESLEEEATHILEEGRMVLPGVQALFGFQLISVFDPSVRESLTDNQKICHLIAISLVAGAVALLMTPAAYHRQVDPGSISRRFVDVATRVITLGMFFLSVGFSLDFYLIARLILRSHVPQPPHRDGPIPRFRGSMVCPSPH